MGQKRTIEMSDKDADALAAAVLGSQEAAESMKRRLNAQEGASKRVKAKTRVVNRGKEEIALERALRMNMRKACLALGAPLKTVPHPYLDGIKCRADGAVWLPASGVHPGHWTFGALMTGGYCECRLNKQFLYVHRLICEAFHGLCPEDKMEVDHINRDKSDNRPENLRWVTRSTNLRNTPLHDAVARRGSPHTYEGDGYYHAYYLSRKDTQKYKDLQKAARKRYKSTHRIVLCADGKTHAFPLDVAAEMIKLPVKERIFTRKK